MPRGSRIRDLRHQYLNKSKRKYFCLSKRFCIELVLQLESLIRCSKRDGKKLC